MPEPQSTERTARWIQWLRDYTTAATRLTREDSLEVASEGERELVAIECALYARALTLCEGALFLIENDRQLDFRIHSRGAIEAVMHLIALDRDATFVTRMKDDDYRSRQARAKLHLNARDFTGSDETRQMLEEFRAQGLQGARSIEASSLLDGTQFERLYRTYRDISGDAAHVSITSLNRHYVEDPASASATLVVHPALDDFELHMTFTEVGISMAIATLILMKVKRRTGLWDEFQSLVVRYRHMSRSPIDLRDADD